MLSTEKPIRNFKLVEVLQSKGVNTIPQYGKIIKNYLDKPIKNFFTNFISIVNLPSADAKVVEDLNSLLSLMHNVDILTLDFNSKFGNGVYKIKSVDLTYTNKTTLGIILRDRKNVCLSIDLTKSSTEQEVFLEDYDFQTLVALKFLDKKQNAKQRGVPFELTLKDVERLLKTKYCFYSGEVLTLTGEHKLTLDRKDSLVGYTVENTVACSLTVNNLKNKLTEDAMLIDNMSNKSIHKMLVKFAEVFKECEGI